MPGVSWGLLTETQVGEGVELFLKIPIYVIHEPNWPAAREASLLLVPDLEIAALGLMALGVAQCHACFKTKKCSLQS